MSQMSCQDVTVKFGGIVACSNLTLDVEEGKIYGLIGPNGAGKTTLFNVLSRFQNCDQGSVYYRGQCIDSRRPHEMVRLGISRTFQNINLFAEQSTLENILVGAHRLAGNPFANMFALPSARRTQRALLSRAHQVAELLRLEAYLEVPVKNLPYGHRKRVELARALASEPEMILLDEPVAGCNSQEVEELKDFVRMINKRLGITVLLVEHDMSMVMEVCDYVYVISFGSNLAEGTPAEIRRDPRVISAYLGEEE